MEVNELRIGNRIKFWGTEDYVFEIRFQESGKGYFVDTFSYQNIPIDEIEGIVLTEEWLLNLGFECREYFKMKDDFLIKLQYDGYVLIGNKYAIGKTFKYIHQLQNIYLSLTDKELEIKNHFTEKIASFNLPYEVANAAITNNIPILINKIKTQKPKIHLFQSLLQRIWK
jgi:hypothetical protein